MIVGIASIILAIVFAFRAYYKGIFNPKSKLAAENIRTAGILIASAVSILLLGLIIALVMFGSAFFTSVNGLKALGSSMILIAIGVVGAGLLIAGMVYSWIAYTNSIDTSISIDVLIVAIASSIAIISPFLSKNGFSAIPLLGENVSVNATLYPNINISPEYNSNNIPLENIISSMNEMSGRRGTV
jgi:hypothetical protein